MPCWSPVFPILLQCVVHLAPVQPMTSYTQLNHDEPTNAVKETTVTSEQDEFRAPGVGERDLLWDHVGDLAQRVAAGDAGQEESKASTPGDLEEAGAAADQIEDSVGNATSTPQDRTAATEQIGESAEAEGRERSLPTAPLLRGTAAGGGGGGKGSQAKETEGRSNRTNVPGKLILYPGRHSRFSDSAIGNITKDLSATANGSSERQKPKQIIYDTSDPFSVIFGEVKTEFKTDRFSNMTGADRENIIGGLAVRRVEQLLKKEDREKGAAGGGEATTAFAHLAVHTFDEERDQYGSEQEERELRENGEVFEFGRVKSGPHDDGLFSRLEIGPGPSKDEDFDKFEERPGDSSPFKEWDTVSEEQEKMLEDMVLENRRRLDGPSRDALPPQGRWFVLLLAGNSTIVRLRQKDFAKYLKLNLAARLSLEYDEVKVNRVVLAPPRLMVNVSVVPTNEGNNRDLDEEIDLEDKVFGEEEAPLHRLAETNATLLELSGEEYHVVRFLSLRSQQPIQLDDSPSATTSIVSDRHTDIEIVIYVVVGGTCALAVIATFFFAVIRYLRTAPISWPWKGAKPIFIPWSLPRHQRMGEERAPTIGGPLTVIYSGTFVDRTAPNSGSWIEDCQPPPENAEVPRNQPVYGFGALSSSALPEIGDPRSAVREGPRFSLDRKLHILGCRPNHFLIPHQPARPPGPLDVRIPPGVDNPNYQS